MNKEHVSGTTLQGPEQLLRGGLETEAPGGQRKPKGGFQNVLKNQVAVKWGEAAGLLLLGVEASSCSRPVPTLQTVTSLTLGPPLQMAAVLARCSSLLETTAHPTPHQRVSSS